VARDRQRAKQRKARRAQNPGPAPRAIHRSNVTGELEHASGEVDEFDAALVAGAEGRDAEADADVEPDVPADAGLEAERPADEVLEVEHPEELSEEGFAELEDEVDELAAEPAADEAEEAGAVAASRAERPAAGRRREAPAAGASTAGGAGRFLAFLRASWAELQRVQWPDRRQVAQATAVVIGFVIVAGLYLGLADRVAQELVDFIL
jgi:preprotein translocase subunit SecE